MPAHCIGQEGPTVVFGPFCQLPLGRVVPHIEETVPPLFVSFLRNTPEGLLKPRPLDLTNVVVQFGERTVYFSHKKGKVLLCFGNDGHMDMVGHGTEAQNSYVVTGSNRANSGKPYQIVALAVVVGRSLVTVIKDATFEWTVFHRYDDLGHNVAALQSS